MKLVVTSPSFSKNIRLCEELKKYFSDYKLNNEGYRFNRSELIEFIGDAEAVVVGLETLDSSTLKQLKKLKIISKYGVGLNNIDLDYCKKNNIHIGWTGGVNKLSVAEMTLGFMLMMCRNLYVSSNLHKSQKWEKNGGFQLSGKKIGIIGVGHIGKEVIRLLKPFNCNIFVNDIIDQHEYYLENKLKEMSKETIFKESDIISIHTPLDDSTKDMVDRNILKSMKPSAFIINSARGGIVNENDLKVALTNNEILGAAIDSYLVEPPKDTELLSLPNLICTPHIGGNAKEAVEAMGMSAIKHIREYIKK